MTTKFDELAVKLKEIFQIDKPELDFGIYKIVNAKAEMIQKFLTNSRRSGGGSVLVTVKNLTRRRGVAEMLV